MMRRGGTALLLIAFSLLTSGATAHAESAWVPLNQRKSAETNWRLPFVFVARSAVPIHFHALVMAVTSR